MIAQSQKWHARRGWADISAFRFPFILRGKVNVSPRKSGYFGDKGLLIALQQFLWQYEHTIFAK